MVIGGRCGRAGRGEVRAPGGRRWASAEGRPWRLAWDLHQIYLTADACSHGAERSVDRDPS